MAGAFSNFCGLITAILVLQVAVARAVAQPAGRLDSQRIIVDIQRKIMSCWNVEPGALTTDYVPQVEFKLNEDGSLNGAPRVTNEPKSDPQKRAADLAVRAVTRCSPLKGLPAEHFQAWRHLVLAFDARGMFR